MKAAIGNSLLFGIIITFVTIVLLIIISSIVYTKAYRIKNRIVDEIEKAETYNPDVDTALTTVFREIGYKANKNFNNLDCDDYEPAGGTLINGSTAYHYCVFELPAKRGGHYYKVVAFAYLDLPLVSALQVPVYGETKIFYD